MRAQYHTGFFVLLCSILLTLAGCGGIPSIGGGGGGSGEDYSTGTQGLALEFLPSAPPPCPRAVYQGDPVDVDFEIFNRGITAAGGTIYLSGFDPNIFSGLSNTLSVPSVEGKSRTLPDGGVATVSGGFNVNLPTGVDQYEPSIVADLCYNYKTTATVQVCVDSDPRNNDGDACSSGQVDGVGGGQGAPIAITKVSTEASSTRTTFLITVANKGGGLVYKQGADCRDPEPVEEDTIVLSSAVLSGQALDCSQAGSELRLSGGSATIDCRFTPQAGAGAYMTPLTLEFDYGYRQTDRIQVCAKR